MPMPASTVAAIEGKGREVPVRMQSFAVRRYPPASAMLASSVGLGWAALVELLAHDIAEAPPVVPPHVEICLVIAGNNNGLVKRIGGDIYQEAVPSNGAIWLSPAGVGKEIAITAPIPQTLHLYLPTVLFRRLNDDFNLSTEPANSIRYAAGIQDHVVEHLGRSILAELANETSASRVFVETASLTLAARLVQHYSDSGAAAPVNSTVYSLDHKRLSRVLDYIAANLQGDITLDALAGIAGYSPFHFARKFALAMNVSPHRYISRLRLEKAMAELATGALSLTEIALNARFSSQASFTRAFRRATGMTPNEYRRRRR